MVNVLFLSACSPVKLPGVASYSLTSLHAKKAPGRSRTNITLGVTAPSASPGYETSDMIYMITPYQLSSFALHKWVAPPAQMILPIVVQAIRSTGYFKAVVSAPYSATTNYRMDFQLLKLQQEFLLPKSKVRMQVQVNLFNNRTSKIIASRRFNVLVPAASNTPYSGVLAANKAITQIASQIARFCKSKLH